MADVMNQDEIDDLFESDAVRAKEAKPAPDEPESGASDVGAQIYDFRRPARISKDRKRSLEAIYGLLVKTFEGWLAGRTRAPIQMELSALDQLTFGEFQMSLASPCAAYSFEVVQSPAQNCVIALGSRTSPTTCWTGSSGARGTESDSTIVPSPSWRGRY